MAFSDTFDAETPDTSDSDQPTCSTSNEVTTDTWKGQLDFDRACNWPEQRCWLCTELTAWNQVMHGLAFVLVELRPGKLSLRTIPHSGADGWRTRTTAPQESSFIVSWLLQHHRCIGEFKVAFGIHACFGKQKRFPICLRPATGCDSGRTIRRLEVEQHIITMSNFVADYQRDCYKLKDLDAVGGVEVLKIDCNRVKRTLAAELAKLMRRNSSSIKTFKISQVKVPRHINNAIRYLFSCESLTISSYHNWYDRLPSMNSVARLMRTSTALKELSIYPIASRRQISAIAKELETNASLTKLGVHIAKRRCSPEAVFIALQVNTTLRELSVTGCHISAECGQALASVLRKNTNLHKLYIKDFDISEFCLAQLACALKENTTLETLHLSSETLPMNGITALCNALLSNKTLKKLLCADFKCSQELRNTLARQLTHDNCYGRVQLPWSEPDLPGLTAAVASLPACFEEVCLPDISCLSKTSLGQLFDVLSSSTCVRTLRVCIKGDPKGKGTALCEMLKVNRCIKCLDLAIDKDEYKFVEEITHALAGNTGITKIELGIHVVRRFETATAVSYLLAHNKTATKFLFTSTTRFDPKFVRELSQGMLQNKIIVKFGLARHLLCDDESFPLFEAVRRNQGALNRAVDFVVSPSLDRQCAEGFELFSGRSCLLKHLMKVTGKTEPEALLGIAASEHYLLDNYLRITGIVRQSVKCHQGKGTQVDALNEDCWRAVVRYLKIADVL